MTARGLLVVLVGAGVLAGAVPATAGSGAPGGRPALAPSAGDAPPAGRSSSPAEAGEERALALLAQAAQAARDLTYSGTQYVATWREDAGSTALVDIRHSPLTGAVVTVPPTAAGPGRDEEVSVDTTAIDERLLEVLASSYALVVDGDGRCAGRSATVVEARRDDGSAAGRFWLDDASGLVLRREVYDDQGRRLRSSAFLDLELTAAPEPVTPVLVASSSPSPVAVAGRRVGKRELARLRRDGWPLPEELPGGLRLFDARVRDHGEGRSVLHLAYSDGLSMLSLFSQRGRLGTEPVRGFERTEVEGAPVWVRGSSPERVVWAGGGRVWTLVTDAPAGVVREAVTALPHDRPPRDGVMARLGRGLSRLGGMLNPFS